MIRSSASAAASAAGSIRGVTDGLTMTPTPAADGCDVSVESNRGRTAEEMTAILQSFSESLLNVAGMYVLIKYAGMQVMAVVLTTVVISTLTNVIFHPMYAAKCLGVRLTTFLPDVIKHIFLCGLLTGVFALLNLVIVPGSWVSFAGAVLLYGVAGGCILFMLIFNRQEKKKLFGFVFGKVGGKA